MLFLNKIYIYSIISTLILQYKMKVVFLLLAIVLPFVICQQYTYGYICNVPNCQVCSYQNLCGLCNNNYILQINVSTSIRFCQSVNCSIANCQTCYQDNICSACVSGFYLAGSGACISGTKPYTCKSSRCLSCDSSSCLICKLGYNLQNGDCFPNNGIGLTQCQIFFTAFSCQLCSQYNIVNPAFVCAADPLFTCNSIQNCLMCRTQYGQTQIMCIQCEVGYQVTQAGTCAAQTCSIQNCKTCNQKNCSQCTLPYYLSNNQCVLMIPQCNVPNCDYCVAANSCGQCAEGYVTLPLIQAQKSLGVICKQLVSSVPNSIDAPVVTNCLKFNPMIPGTSQLLVGCIQCQQGFINVRGYCVANLTQSYYICNVPNCKYCIHNNLCGVCSQGYTVYLGSGNQCTKNYSPIANCLLTPLQQFVCAKCAPGYALVSARICVLMPQNLFCNITGCNFCLQNNTCSVCLEGYLLNASNNTCTPLCNVTYCFQCGSNTQCQICQFGFYLSNNQCINATGQPASYCSSNFGVNCTECTYYYCLGCSTGNVINPKSDSCCPAPIYNFANCSQYGTIWQRYGCFVSVKCILCKSGTVPAKNYFGGMPQCTSLPCSIPKCTYCFTDVICAVCNPGFNLINNTCTSYNASQCNLSNCASCYSNNTCQVCLTGYILYNGGCVCKFQNCLACQGSAYCTLCALPTIATLTSSQGCLPEIVPLSQCNVANCLNCMNANFCSQCFPGYSLLPNGACYPNTCNLISNCAVCSQDQRICYQCNQNYILKNAGSNSCTKIPKGYSCEVSSCFVCQTFSPQVCASCAPFYSLVNNICIKNNCTANCAFCYTANSCTVCLAGFYLADDFTCFQSNSLLVSCPSTFNNCVGCQQITKAGVPTVICTQCSFGLQRSSDQLSCVAQTVEVPNCVVRIQTPQQEQNFQICLVCQQGYTLNPYLQCVAYSLSSSIPNCSNIFNCIYCSDDNYCDYCVEGWSSVNGSCVTTSFCNSSNCIACTSPANCIKCISYYSLNGSSCIPMCNIQNCKSCSTPNVCGTCISNLTLNFDNTCTCPFTFSFINNTCLCPAGSTLSEGSCVGCNVQNCYICSTLNVCQKCIGNLTLNANNTCTCPDSTFLIVNNNCQCPQNTSLLSSTCISCNIANCLACSAADTCQQCARHLTLNNNACSCPDTTFTIVNGSCVCPVNTTLSVTGNTCINCNIQNCQLCSSTNKCQTCINNLTLSNNQCSCQAQQTLINQTCIACTVSNCINCSATNNCSKCVSGFTESAKGQCICPTNTTLSDNKCVSCSIDNCTLCVQSNICQTCSVNFNLVNFNGSTVCIFCNIANCLNCSSPSYCTTCANSLQVSSQGNQCVNCSITNCSICSSNNVCAVCQPGYQLSSDMQSCILCPIQGCLICSQSTTCLKCMSGYSLNSAGSCSVCLAPCATCNGSAYNCLTCLYPFSQVASSNGTCFTCNVQNCLSCSRNSPYTCSQCLSNYSLINNTCYFNGPCSINCVSCLLNQICLLCSTGYTVSPYISTQCIQCNIKHCHTCSPTDTSTCLVCSSGFYQQGGFCYSCPYLNCQICTSSACLSYKKSTGQISINVQGSIYPVICDPGCLNCSVINPMNCISCMPGYTLNSNGLCIPCAYPCQTCQANSPSKCTSCYGNGSISGNTCILCNGNCLTCLTTNTSFCTSCPSNYYLANGNCNLGCPNNCAVCSSSSSCSICVSGYSANSQGVCLPCLSNCRVCSGNAQGICLQCGLGFYLSNQICVACSAFCRTCNYQGCLTCIPGYSLDSQANCYLNCAPPCASCSQTSQTTCKSCLYGYTYHGLTNQCEPIVNCPSGVCYACPIGYSLLQGQCIKCNTTSNCARCNPKSPSNCLTCLNGYYLNNVNSSCLQCAPNCVVCSNSQSCTTCSLSYTLVLQPIESAGTCVQCQLPCIQCITSPKTCTACVAGFTLNGWKCQSAFNFGFSMKLNTSLSNFYNNYQQFLQVLVSSLTNSTINAVTMMSISSNSTSVSESSSQLEQTTSVVSVSGYISTTQQSNSTAAGNSFYGLNTTLSNGTIATMPIISFTLTVNGGLVPPPTPPNPDNNSHQTLYIVLGICIPITVIILIIIIYLIVRKSTEKSIPPVDYKQNDSTLRNTFQLEKKQISIQ